MPRAGNYPHDEASIPQRLVLDLHDGAIKELSGCAREPPRRTFANFSFASYGDNAVPAVISCSSAWGQVEAGQTVASIPLKDGELLVQNGTNNDVWLVADDERISINAEEALRVAAWIKEGKMGDYGNTGSVAFRREAGILVVTFAPEKAGKRELRLEDAEAIQLAAGLASVRQNVSEAGQ